MNFILIFVLFYSGNPFKIDKRMMVDEADMDIVGTTSSASKGIKRALPSSDGVGPQSPRPLHNKRKPGPIPRDVVVRRPTTPVPSPPSSPIPWMDEPRVVVIPPPIVNSIPPLIVVPSTSSSSSPPVPSVISSPPPPEKLVNGLAELPPPAIPIFEPIPVEPFNNHLQDTPPVLTPMVNNLEARTTEPKNDHLRIVEEAPKPEPKRPSAQQNNVVENNVIARNESQPAEDKLTNHVSEPKPPKLETEKVLTQKELDDIRRHNADIRKIVYREIRKKGNSELTRVFQRNFYYTSQEKQLYYI